MIIAGLSGKEKNEKLTIASYVFVCTKTAIRPVNSCPAVGNFFPYGSIINREGVDEFQKKVDNSSTFRIFAFDIARLKN